ncbi:MAG: carbon-nitrogen hydrolase family protein [Halarcobacter sp.]
MEDLQKFKVASVQDAPVFLDKTATTKKACGLIEKAASNGANLVAFPEVFLAGYPYWNWIMTPVQGSAWFEKLYKASVDVPGPEVTALCQAAKENNIFVVMGINERDEHSIGTIYNTLLVIDNEGNLIGNHRKLVPTWAEKLTWTGGNGSSLNVYKTKTIGNLGVLACGENTNTLARFALLAQGENLHIANYISLPVAPEGYDMAEAIKIRSMAHSFEGKVFTIVSCSTISEEIIEIMGEEIPNAKELLTRKNSAYSGIIGPDGREVSKPLIDEVGIVYAEVDLNKCIQAKQMHDILGHYNRFDVFNLTLDKRDKSPLEIIQNTPKAKDDNDSDEIVQEQI